MSDQAGKAKLPATPWGHLPPSMRVLFITGAQRTGGWLADAFASDSATEVVLEEVLGIANGVSRLRDDSFDAVLISHEPGELDALELLDAVRAGTSPHQPIVILGSISEQDMAAYCFEAGADAYVCVNTSTIRTLIWHVARAAERQKLISENRRFSQAHRHRLQLEHDEATRLLAQQRSLVDGLEQIRCHGTYGKAEAPPCHSGSEFDQMTELPAVLGDHYRELLRAYIIMGSGRLGEEMDRLAELLASAGVTAQQTMHLHLSVLEKMVCDLGYRSARHVMNRAGLLILEVMVNLAEQYRRRAAGTRQRDAPGLPGGLDLENSAA